MSDAEVTPTRYSIRAAAARAGVSAKTIRGAIRSKGAGRLPAILAVGLYGEEYAIEEAALDAWIAARGGEPTRGGVFTPSPKGGAKGSSLALPGGDFATLLEAYRAQVEALSREVADLRERAGRAEERVALLGEGSKRRGLLGRLLGE